MNRKNSLIAILALTLSASISLAGEAPLTLTPAPEAAIVLPAPSGAMNLVKIDEVKAAPARLEGSQPSFERLTAALEKSEALTARVRSLEDGQVAAAAATGRLMQRVEKLEAAREASLTVATRKGSYDGLAVVLPGTMAVSGALAGTVVPSALIALGAPAAAAMAVTAAPFVAIGATAGASYRWLSKGCIFCE